MDVRHRFPPAFLEPGDGLLPLADGGPRSRSIRTFTPEELIPQLDAAGSDRTVLVQVDGLLRRHRRHAGKADAYDFIAAVVGWVPLDRPDEAAKALERYGRHPKFAGVRHFIHDEPDPDWVVRD